MIVIDTKHRNVEIIDQVENRTESLASVTQGEIRGAGEFHLRGSSSDAVENKYNATGRLWAKKAVGRS